MRRLIQHQFALCLCLASVVVLRADTLNYGFDSGQDYVADGIIGFSPFDGVYLNYGDIPNASQGGGGQGTTIIASEDSPYPTFLNLQNAGGDWSGADNDGFFLYKVVEGDFDVSVANLAFDLQGGFIYDNGSFNLAGLQVRAYNPDNSGAGYSTSDTNNPTAENSMRLWRFQQFDIDGQIRVSTNGANQEYTYAPNLNTSTNEGYARYYRITRTDNVFAFYYRTNTGDAWTLATDNPFGGMLTRSDWDGVAVQVGIAQATFDFPARDAVFDDFELSGTNVTFPPLPASPSSLVSTGSDPTGSLTLSWTKGSAANNTLVVIRESGAIQHGPINGRTYVPNPGFGQDDNLIGGADHYVVYNGSGTSVTVTNLGGNFISYNVAVFEYSGSGSSTVYNTENPAINSFPGPGEVVSMEIVTSSSNIVAGSAVQLGLIAIFSTGETSDVSSSPDALWSSDNPLVADVVDGTVSGLSAGSANISVSIGTLNPSLTITVDAFAGFQDDFTAAHDYAANGLPGTPYNGMFLDFGDVPNGIAGGDGVGSTLFMDAQISDTNGLYVSSVQSTWENTANDGPFLFQIVPGSANGLAGDFSATLHIESMNTLNGVVAGLMARLYNPTDGGAGPPPPVQFPPLQEHHVEFWKVQDGATSVRQTIRQGQSTTTTIVDGEDVNWLLMTRVNSTNFYFFEKIEGEGALWTKLTNVVMEAAAGDAPMQVGIAQQSTLGVNAITTLDNFQLSAPGVNGVVPPPAATGFTMTGNEDESMTLEWVASDGGTPVQSIAVMRAGGPVSSQPAPGADFTGDSTFGEGTDLGGGNYVVYVSDNPPASTSNSVNVTGLAAGVIYHAAIYTFTGEGASRVFNIVGAPSDSQVGSVLEGIEASLPGGIPLSGIGKLIVEGVYTGGVRQPLTAGVTITSGDTNVVKLAESVLTGISIGTAPVTVMADGFTNVVEVEVRQPTFTDDFSVSRDYLSAGVAGSGYDELYNPAEGVNPIPLSPYAPLAGSGATAADANISSNGVFTLTDAGDGWEGGAAGGFFLFQYVPSDFQVAVQIANYEIEQYHQPGLLARAYGIDTNTGLAGAPFGTVVTNANGTNNLGEYWVSFCRFDEFGIGTYARRNIDSAVSQNTQGDQDDDNWWLLIVRSEGTEFDFYKRMNATDPWVQVPNGTHYSLSQFAGQPMQVGIMSGPWSNPAGAPRTVVFDNFMLDVAAASLQIGYSEGDVYLTYPSVGGYGLESTVTLAPVDWQSVTGTPVATNGGLITVTVPATGDESFFRLVQ